MRALERQTWSRCLVSKRKQTVSCRVPPRCPPPCYSTVQWRAGAPRPPAHHWHWVSDRQPSADSGFDYTNTIGCCLQSPGAGTTAALAKLMRRFRGVFLLLSLRFFSFFLFLLPAFFLLLFSLRTEDADTSATCQCVRRGLRPLWAAAARQHALQRTEVRVASQDCPPARARAARVSGAATATQWAWVLQTRHRPKRR